MPKTEDRAKTVSAGPLFKRIENKRGGKAAFAKRLGIDHGRLSNWKSRGLPWSQVKRVAEALDLTLEQYLAEAGQPQNVARQPTAQYTLEARQLLEDFAALPSWLQDHIARKTTELRRYADALPAIIRDGMKAPPKDPEAYRLWERNMEDDRRARDPKKEKVR